MNITISPAPLHGTVSIIESKSHVHRLLIAAALSSTPVFISCNDSSEDIDATVRCLNALGAEITRSKDEDGFWVVPFKASQTAATLECGESGSTLRFLLPIIGALGKTATIRLSGRLPERPLSPLWEELIAHGVSLTRPQNDTICCSGKLKAGTFTIKGDVSSQFISGLLFALPFLDGDSEIVVTGKTESESYIEMTLQVLHRVGINIQRVGQNFMICGNQVAKCSSVAAEGDWSNAAFWLCAGALGSPITCKNLYEDSLQGDRSVIDLLKRFGAVIQTSETATTVKANQLNGIEIDASNSPDLVPILAVCGAYAKGTTVIKNAGRLRIKESDRLAAVSTVLSALGASVTETEDGLIIQGQPQLKGGVTVSSYNDHRIAMAAAVAATLCQDPVTITNAEAVNKSYPKFWEHLERLGGKIRRD